MNLTTTPLIFTRPGDTSPLYSWLWKGRDDEFSLNNSSRANGENTSTRGRPKGKF